MKSLIVLAQEQGVKKGEVTQAVRNLLLNRDEIGRDVMKFMTQERVEGQDGHDQHAAVEVLRKWDKMLNPATPTLARFDSSQIFHAIVRVMKGLKVPIKRGRVVGLLPEHIADPEEVDKG